MEAKGNAALLLAIAAQLAQTCHLRLQVAGWPPRLRTAVGAPIKTGKTGGG